MYGRQAIRFSVVHQSFFLSTRSNYKDMGEMTKKTLDNVWNTTRKVKEAVAGDEEKKYEVPPTDHLLMI
ncbi:hypothetical protein R6Q59_026046 [Mikania micrantha]